jgi:hypothetical protein
MTEPVERYFLELRASLRNALDAAQDAENEVTRLLIQNLNIQSESDPHLAHLLEMIDRLYDPETQLDLLSRAVKRATRGTAS